MELLFDIDDVLINSKKDVYQCYEMAFKKYNLVFSEKMFEDDIWGNTWERAAKTLCIKRKLAGQIHRYKNELYSALEIKVDPNIQDFINSFDRGEILFLSSGSAETTSMKLKKILGDLGGVSFMFEVNKSDSKFWENFCIEHKSECIFIDNSLKNCQAAKAAGITTIQWRLL